MNDDHRVRKDTVSGDTVEARSGWDGVADDLLPADLDWRRLARSYPLPVLTVAAVGGFLVGRERGMELIGVLTEFFTGKVSENVRAMLGPSGASDGEAD